MTTPNAEEGIVRWAVTVTADKQHGFPTAGHYEDMDGDWVRYEDHVAEVAKCAEAVQCALRGYKAMKTERDALARRVGRAMELLRYARSEPGDPYGWIDAFLAGEGA